MMENDLKGLEVVHSDHESDLVTLRKIFKNIIETFSHSSDLSIDVRVSYGVTSSVYELILKETYKDGRVFFNSSYGSEREMLLGFFNFIINFFVDHYKEVNMFDLRKNLFYYDQEEDSL